MANDFAKDSRRQTAVLIIGAGPSGLALGKELAARGIAFVILDKGSIGDSWARMAAQLKLVSPWKCNWLSRDDSRRHAPNEQVSRAQFLNYLREYALANELPIQCGCEVLSVRRDGDGFQVTTSQGDLFSRIIVNATGYFSNPTRPQIEGAKTTEIPQSHYADYQSAEQLRGVAGANALVLLVGKRLSAGQTMLELVDAGFQVALSHHSPIRFGVDDWLWPFVYRSFAHFEKLKLILWADRAPAIDVRMPGGRAKRLIQSGTVKTFPAIDRLEKDSVVFVNGERLKPGIVLYATGFAPALRHLAELNLAFCPETGSPLTRQMESISVSGLFFLGFEMLRNFQSRFLRGLRNDAVALGEIIAERAARVPTQQRDEPCLT